MIFETTKFETKVSSDLGTLIKKMSVDISLMVEKFAQESDSEEADVDKSKFFSPGDIITKYVLHYQQTLIS